MRHYSYIYYIHTLLYLPLDFREAYVALNRHNVSEKQRRLFFNRAPIKALKRHYRGDARNQGELRNELGILEVSGVNQGFCSECIRC